MDGVRPRGTTPHLDTLPSFSLGPEAGISLSSQSGFPLLPGSPPRLNPGTYSRFSGSRNHSPTRARTPLNASPKSPDTYPDCNRDAVMTALKKLQFKIRQLEVERSAAEGNLRSLATETSKYRDLLNKDRMETSRMYDPVQTEMSKNTQEVQTQLSSAENRCHLLEKQLDYMRRMVQDAEADKQRVLDRQRAKEFDQVRQDENLKVRVETLSDLQRDHVKLSAHQNKAEKKIQDLEEKLGSEIENRRKAEDILKASLSPAQNRKMAQASRPEEKRKMKKKRAPNAKTPKVQNLENHRLHYHLNLNEMPFLRGKSTGPSHHVSANVQKVLSLMKSHNNVMCERAVSVKQDCVAPSSSSSGSEVDMNELILQLQDEYAQMGFEHRELMSQLNEENSEGGKIDLERELELLTTKMEIKSEQITQLKHHLNTLERKKMKRKVQKCRKPSTPTQNTIASANRQQVVKQVVKNRTKSPSRSPPSRVRPQSADHESRLQILRDMKKLQSTLRPDDLSWDL